MNGKSFVWHIGIEGERIADFKLLHSSNYKERRDLGFGKA
jgi:hypothetical protein